MVTFKGKKITIDNFTACIPEEQLIRVMGKANTKKFMKWMRGQTVPLEGVYEWDLSRWLRGKNVID